jgi:SpoVK/Ycf46/Vps4 family AAA+-type ATPase
MPISSEGKIELFCGKCKKPLFNTNSINQNNINSIIGLEKVKKEIIEILNSVKINEARVQDGLPRIPQTLHFVFQGEPGTGKTHVARVLSNGLKEIGLLAKGHLVEADRAKLVGQWQGHTALKVSEVCQSALGGVLFIDEAYSLNWGSGDSFGQEAVDTLIKHMEDNRDNLVVIIAGYSQEIGNFLNTNPGLKSRFTRFIEFPNYSIRELCNIFRHMINRHGLYMSDDAKAKIFDIFSILTKRNSDFGNARGVRNVSERLFSIQAQRLSELSDISKENFVRLEIVDFEVLLGHYKIPKSQIKKILY